MSGTYNIKIKNGNMEIDVSGPEEAFVSEKFKEILVDIKESEFFKIPDIVQSTTQLSQENTPKLTNLQTNESSTSNETGRAKLAIAAGVSEDELSNIFDFKDGDVYIHREIKGNDAERQKIVAKLALIANYYVKGVSELSGKALGKYMNELAIGSMGNLAKNLKNGKGINKIKTSYKLNAIGKKEAFELIKSYSNY